MYPVLRDASSVRGRSAAAHPLPRGSVRDASSRTGTRHPDSELLVAQPDPEGALQTARLYITVCQTIQSRTERYFSWLVHTKCCSSHLVRRGFWTVRQGGPARSTLSRGKGWPLGLCAAKRITVLARNPVTLGAAGSKWTVFHERAAGTQPLPYLYAPATGAVW